MDIMSVLLRPSICTLFVWLPLLFAIFLSPMEQILQVPGASYIIHLDFLRGEPYYHSSFAFRIVLYSPFSRIGYESTECLMYKSFWYFWYAVLPFSGTALTARRNSWTFSGSFHFYESRIFLKAGDLGSFMPQWWHVSTEDFLWLVLSTCGSSLLPRNGNLL